MGQHRDPVRKGQALTRLGPRDLQRLWHCDHRAGPYEGKQGRAKARLAGGFWVRDRLFLTSYIADNIDECNQHKRSEGFLTAILRFCEDGQPELGPLTLAEP
jgi:hypothetical protein